MVPEIKEGFRASAPSCGRTPCNGEGARVLELEASFGRYSRELAGVEPGWALVDTHPGALEEHCTVGTVGG